MRIIERKVLKGRHSPVTVKVIQAEYPNSPIFQRPSDKAAIRRIDTLIERY